MSPSNKHLLEEVISFLLDLHIELKPMQFHESKLCRPKPNCSLHECKNMLSNVGSLYFWGQNPLSLAFVDVPLDFNYLENWFYKKNDISIKLAQFDKLYAINNLPINSDLNKVCYQMQT